MQFWKMNGAGNDFVVLNNLVEKLPAEMFPEIARTLCERHMSIGADGLMVEVHNNPACAKCDGAQSLTPEKFARMMDKLNPVVELMGKKMV